MRQVFSSLRLENVERVAQLLREAGIEVQILNGRSYKGSRRSHFSYRESNNTGPKPAVWVTHSSDQTRARQLLRDAGLLQAQPSTRSFLGQTDVVFAPRETAPKRGLSRAAKVRYTLLGGAVLIIALSWLGRPDHAPEAATPVAETVPTTPELAMVPEAVDATVNRIPVPRALAALVLREALGEIAGPVCVAVDGDAPVAQVLAELDAGSADIRLPMECNEADEAHAIAWLEVANYRTDGSGQGTLELTSGSGDAARGLVTRVLEVRRTGREWEYHAAN